MPEVAISIIFIGTAIDVWAFGDQEPLSISHLIGVI
jgi:hypothetical protein